MTTAAPASWRKVDDSDFNPSIGWVEDDMYEEIPLFKEFISPYNRKKPEIVLGSIYRLWKEFRGIDVEYSLSVMDIRRLWTALSVAFPDDPLYSTVPADYILYDTSTKAIVNRIKEVPAYQ